MTGRELLKQLLELDDEKLDWPIYDGNYMERDGPELDVFYDHPEYKILSFH